MPTRDDELLQITRDRLHAVAARRVGAADPSAGVTDGVRLPAAPGSTRRARHRDDRPHGATSEDGATGPPAVPRPRWSPVAGGAESGQRLVEHRAELLQPPVETDAGDVVARVRGEALAAASTAYADAHGHPLDRAAGAPRRRWYLSVRQAVVAGAAVTVLGAGVVVRAVLSVPDGPEPLATSVTAADLGATQVAGPAGAAAAAVGGGVGANPGPGGPDAPGSGATGAAGPAGGRGAEAGPPAASAGAAGASGVAPGPEVAVPGVPDGGRVVVHVVGQVGSPGIVELPAGSRVADALAVAGGTTSGADLSAVNLARVVGDGEQIVVPAPGEVVPPPPAGPGSLGAGAGSPAARSAHGPGGAAVALDLNTAGLAELDGLPGIGPVLAQRILDWRAAHGPFRQVEELGEVSGIGDALLGRLAPLVRV